MKLHEYQAKKFLCEYGIPTPKGIVINKNIDTSSALESLGGEAVAKAQVYAGGRGQSGGIIKVSSASAAEEAVNKLLGSTLVTYQTSPEGVRVSSVLLEETVEIHDELYLSMVTDGSSGGIAIISSREGGVSIEEVARDNPELIFKAYIDPTIGMMPYISRSIAIALKLDNSLFNPFSKLLQAMYSLFLDLDTSLIEINPLAITKKQELLALDAKIEIEEDALFRHPDVIKLKDHSQVDPLELKAENAGVNYVKLDGDIGCLVNGAGLAMATMDVITNAGFSPANFLDVGGTANQETVAEATRIILSDPSVKRIFINIFGGIVQCDMVVNGVIEAMNGRKNPPPPIIARLMGTNQEEARQILSSSGLDVILPESLTEASKAISDVRRNN